MSLDNKNPICYIAKTNFRRLGTPFGILLKDRLHHFYILGKTGTGKTTLRQRKISQDISDGRGVCLIDVHGDLVSKVISSIPSHRTDDVIYLDATNPNLS
jgi:hypothetical protein